MEHLVASISFIAIFVTGGIFYMALPIIDPTLAVQGVSVNKRVRGLERENRFLENRYKIYSQMDKIKTN
jgi:hypothetical protein